MGKRGGAGTEYKDKAPEQKKDGTVVKSYQRMPTQILNEWCQGQKRPKPEFRGVRSYDRSLCRFKVVLPDPKDVAKSLEFEANRDAETPFAAREEAALVALLKLCPDMPLERKLPDGYRETWLEAIGEAASAKAKAKPKTKAAAKGSAVKESLLSGREAAEQEKQAALARKAQEQQMQQLTADEQRNICFEWQRTGRCRRTGCRFDHPPNTSEPLSEPMDHSEVEPKYKTGSSAPLGAVHGHMSKADMEREKRERKEAWAQEKNRREALRDMKKLANMKARIILARRMRGLIFKALNLGSEYAAQADADEAMEDLTDAEAAALQQVMTWGFTEEAAQRALLAERSSTSTEDLAERLRIWLCLHLPEEEIPEAFAAHKGQFEVHKPKPAVPRDAQEVFLAWLREQMDAHLEDAEGLWASVEVLLRTEGDEEDRSEALEAAKAMLEADGFPEDLLEELRTRWDNLRTEAVDGGSASTASVLALSQKDNSETVDLGDDNGDGDDIADETLGNNDDIAAEVPADIAPQKQTSARSSVPPFWFGWKADGAPNGLDGWQQSSQGQKMKKSREALPAFKVKDELAKLLASNQVVLVHGETGSGKTTQIGQFILDGPSDRPPRVVVTQPRRFAALSVARRVAEERGEDVGTKSVGYMVRGETKMHTQSCQLLFCTLGVLLRRVISQGDQQMFTSQDMTHLVLDEVHERSMDMDFVLTLLRHALPSRPKLKVLLMSATMDIQSLAQLFPKTPPVLKIPGRTFPVEVLHLEEVEDLLGTTYSWSVAPKDSQVEASQSRGPQPASMNYDLLADFVLGLVDGSYKGSSWPGEGAILIFMPGAGEISRLINSLERRSTSQKFKALPLHGALSGEQQRRCFDAFEGVRKVIVATNVAETSVTLPDVTIVIDSCRERRLTREHGHSSLAPALLEQFCAKDSMQQRRGRAGRVQKGLCFRLLPRSAYDKLPASTTPEIEALPLETLVLQVRAAGFDPGPFLASAPTPPKTLAVSEAEVELRLMGALKPESQEDESSTGAPQDLLTALGRHLAALPCDVRVGRLLVLGAFLGVASAVCNIAGWLSVRSPMPKAWQPKQEALRDGLRSKALRGGGSRSDHCFWVAIMEAFMAAKSKKAFCNDLGLSLERMVEAQQCRNQLLRGLRSLGFQSDADCNSGDWHIVRAAVVAGFYPQIARVERPPPRFAESLGGAIQIDSNAREVRYWLDQIGNLQTGWQGSRQRAFLHPSSLLFKESSYSCPYVMFSDKTVQQQNNAEHPTKLVLTGCSEGSVYALLLFGGALDVDHQQAEVFLDGGRCSFSGGSTTVVAMLQRLRQATVSACFDSGPRTNSAGGKPSKASRIPGVPSVSKVLGYLKTISGKSAK